MHASVIKTQEHRTREQKRKLANIQKKKKQGLVRAFGLNPAITPSHPDGSRRDRRNQSRPERRMKRFFKNWVNLLNF